MATRKAITLVSGLFQEVNTPTDKLDFAGNTTADLSENTNLYFTNARARGAVSVTDAGGQGSLAYNSSTGVITYTGPSDSDVRGTLSVASGSGLTYNSGTGEFGTSAIPNSQLANDDVTIGSTAIALGATGSTIAGLTSLASGTLIAGVEDAASAIEIGSGNITFEGSTADANETILTAADATGGDKTLTLPNETGTILSTASSIANSNLANSTITFGSASVALGSTVTGISVTNLQAITKLQVGAEGGAGNIILQSSGITFEGATGGADANETLLAVTDPTADRTITLPDATGTVALTTDISYPVTLNNSVTLTNKTLALGSNTISGTLAQFNTAVTDATLVSTTGTETLTNKSLTDPVLTGSSTSAGSIIFKEDTDNGTNSATLKGPASTADVTITLPAETGTVLTTASSIANSNLANSSLTIGSTGIALGGSATTFTGLASITSTAVVTNDSGFRIRNNSDNTKIGAFSSASITAGQTRTLTFPDASGTIATQAYVNSQISAEDLDIEADSGTIAIDLNSEVLDIEGGTNITTAATGNKVTINMPTSFATEDFATAIAVALG